jgi:hypothetical protein
MNRWGIPLSLELQVRKRDRQCVYCHVRLRAPSSKADKRRHATWEHFDNERYADKGIMDINVALCCLSCNSSKGEKLLREWLGSPYCKARKINKSTVASPVKHFLRCYPVRSAKCRRCRSAVSLSRVEINSNAR